MHIRTLLKQFFCLMLQRLIVIILFKVCFIFLFSCGKDDSNKPNIKPLPFDSATASQYMVCKIDTILFYAYVKDGSKDKITMSSNSLVLTSFLAETETRRGSGLPLVRRMELILYDFQTKRQGSYSGAKIFAASRTDVQISNVEADEKYWEIFNAISNRIEVTKLDSNTAYGNFNFKMQNKSNANQFIEVKEGIFKVRIR